MFAMRGQIRKASSRSISVLIPFIYLLVSLLFISCTSLIACRLDFFDYCLYGIRFLNAVQAGSIAS